MKQQILKVSIFSVSILFAMACRKEHVEPKTSKQVQSILFTMNEAPYNDEVEIATRTHIGKQIKDTILWEGVEAEVTLERDTKQSKQETRAITSGNHYTIVVFESGGTQPIAETKGYFDTEGNFKYEAGSEIIKVPAGNYDFVCYTHQYATRSGNTISIQTENIDKAFVCRKTNVTIANMKRQEVAFNMKRLGARIRTKIVAYVEPQNVTAYFLQGNQFPTALIYNLATGTFGGSTTKRFATGLNVQTYNIAHEYYDPALTERMTSVTTDQYIHVLPGTRSEELFYRLIGGTVYHKTIKMNNPRRMKATGEFQANGSYTLTINLLPRYQYLFEDGKAGYLDDTNRQGHIPIGIVFAPHNAIALWGTDQIGFQQVKWYAKTDNAQHNSTIFPTIDDHIFFTTCSSIFHPLARNDKQGVVVKTSGGRKGVRCKHLLSNRGQKQSRLLFRNKGRAQRFDEGNSWRNLPAALSFEPLAMWGRVHEVLSRSRDPLPR